MRGTPQTMQSMNYEDIVKENTVLFSEKVNKARSLGINDLIIDPGFAAKTIKQIIVHKAELFKSLELPLLIGISG
jgi:dihydropteroate synthase